MEFFAWNSDGESSTYLFHEVDGLSSLNPIPPPLGLDTITAAGVTLSALAMAIANL
jgi:hypothetical protein